MIVRIASEGQFEISEAHAERLDELDNAAVAAVESNDEQRFRSLWGEIVDLIEREGRRLADDELVPSDLILPPRDASLEEARQDFRADGLILD